MRVTTPMLYESGTRSILDRQADLLKTQMRLSTGRRVLAPADDPVAAAQALAVGEARARTAQFSANAEAARASLVAAEAAVGDLQDALAGTRDLLLAAGNGALADADRRSIAADLRARLADILAIANRRDGNGRALFAGFREDAVPFVDDGAAVTYAGDQGARAIAIGASREVAVGVSGAALFEGIAVGNGAFTTATGAANAGDVAVSSGTVTDLALLTGHDYEVVFTVLGATTTYDVVDATLGVTVSSGNPYATGASIGFHGLAMRVTGTPATGDRLAVGPPARANLFAAVREAAALLEAPASAPAARGALATGLDRAVTSLDQAAERALGVRTAFGASLREIDAAQASHAALAEGQDAELSRLQDLDYASAVSDFAREQQALEAAQKAFKAATQLSLFALL